MKVRNHPLVGFFVVNDKGEILPKLFVKKEQAQEHMKSLTKSKPVAVKKSKKSKK